jgi:hypothetical protein
MFKKINKRGLKSKVLEASNQEIRNWASRHGLDMFQGSQRLPMTMKITKKEKFVERKDELEISTNTSIIKP